MQEYECEGARNHENILEAGFDHFRETLLVLQVLDLLASLVCTSAGFVLVQDKAVQSGHFTLPEDLHETHIQSAKENSTKCCGVKRVFFTKNAFHFHVSRGDPPDIVHDLECVVPVEIVVCINEINSK